MKRILTAAVAIPLALLATIYAPLWLFALLVAILAALMLDEFFTLSAARAAKAPGKWFLVPASAVAVSFAFGPRSVLAATTACGLCVLTAAVFGDDIEHAFSRVTTGLSGVVYCSLLPGFLILLPRDAVLTIFAIIWAGDSAAYYGGRAFGRHPLAPRVSPKKTVEGAVSGLLASVVAGAAIGSWRLGLPLPTIAIISALTAVAGQIGDLAESALKRSAGVKDSSSILPGHGGILDRLDSLLFAAPVFFWLLGT
jgi:phosphatidate cytidylyltransferase